MAASYPEDLKYTREHEWIRPGDVLRIGITDYAQEALGDIVFLTLPEPGTEVHAGQPCGEVESTKSVSDVYAPVDGTVTARNDDLLDHPDVVNSDPYGRGWMLDIRPNDQAALGDLLDADAYQGIVDAS